MKTDLVVVNGMLGIVVLDPGIVPKAPDNSIWVKPFSRKFASWYNIKNVKYVDVLTIEEAV